ncbi:MAG: hypothetical protein JXA20_11080 [Spirochaetes bacterium]|nr:hypothetical protein [Spirochaetota bacterium]
MTGEEETVRMHMNRSETEALLFHAAFAALCGAVMAVPAGAGAGVRFLALTVLYNTVLPLYARLRGHDGWMPLWRYSLVLSLFQLFPDWILTEVMGILVFPEDGLFKIGTVSGYMPLLWTIPLFILLFAAESVRERKGEAAAYLAAGLIAFILFVGSEQTLWILGSWYPRRVTMVGHVALYIIVPEVLLGIYGYYGYRTSSNRGVAVIGAAFSVMLVYTGAAALSYLIIERIIAGGA